MMHPKNEIDKVYVAKLEGIITGNDINTLSPMLAFDTIIHLIDMVKE